MRWTGAGLAPGTTVTTGNVGTAGNGDVMTLATSGTAAMVSSGMGVDVTATTTGIKRLDSAAFTATLYVVGQFYFTPGETPVGAHGWVLPRSASANILTWVHYTDGKFGALDLPGATVAGLSTTVALTIGDRYKIDWAIEVGGTTSTGRAFYRIADRTNPAWNTTGSFFANTQNTINTGTASATAVRYGRVSGSSTITLPSRLELIGWDPRASLSSSTTQAVLEAEFMPDPDQRPIWRSRAVSRAANW